LDVNNPYRHCVFHNTQQIVSNKISKQIEDTALRTPNYRSWFAGWA